MAVLDPNKKGNRSDGEEVEKRQAAGKDNAGRVVDLFTEKNLPKGETVKLDKDEDAWSFAAPPDAGRYSIKVMPAKELCKLRDRDSEDPSKGVYYSLAMECKVLDKDLSTQLAVVFPYVNTIIGRGKSISTAAGLLVKLGFKIPEEADDYTVAKLCAQAIKMEKVTEVECDWLGQYKDEKGDYKTAWKSQADFPRDAEGKPMHIARYRDSKGNEYEVNARFEIRHWYKKGEASIKPNVANGPVPIRATELIPVLDEPNQNKAAVATANAAVPASGEADLLTLLESD